MGKIKGKTQERQGGKHPLPGRPHAVRQACPLSSVSARPSPGFRLLVDGRSGRVGSDAGINFVGEDLEFGMVLAPLCFVEDLQ